jgi:RNA polymerase sigma-70 factor (ECF subfamily)
VQDVFAALVRALPAFRYQPGGRFRGWLWTVTRNARRAARRRAAAAPGAVPAELPDPDPGGPEEVEEAEYRTHLIGRALQLMQSDFQPATWRACWEHVVDDRPAAEVAARLGVAVYVAKSRVLRRLRQELAGLLD